MKWISVREKSGPDHSDAVLVEMNGYFAVACVFSRGNGGEINWIPCGVEVGPYDPHPWLIGEVTAWAEIKPPDPETCTIFGSEVSFELKVAESEIRSVTKDIWDHSSKYSDYKDNSEDSYYKFTRCLWIRFPDGREVRLADFVNE